MRIRTLTALALSPLLACQCEESLRPLLPKAFVTPDRLEHALLCGRSSDVVELHNTGAATLLLDTVQLAGDGWTLGDLPLPARIERGESLLLPISGLDGTATLRLHTNDPDQPWQEVSLSATANRPPSVRIQPPDTRVVSNDAPLELLSEISDDDSPVVVWRDADQVLPGASSPEGSKSLLKWLPGARPAGERTVSVEVTDACGLKATDSVTLCLDAIESYEPLQLDGWHFEGATEPDASGGGLLLTRAEKYLSGSAFETSRTIGGDNVDITFGFYIGGGTGADGFSLTAVDTTRMTTLLGPRGCGIGYGGDAPCTTGAGLPGWSVEIDTFHNPEVDPTESAHIAFTTDGRLIDPPLWAPLPDLADGQWHTMTLQVRAPHVTASIDGVTYLDGDVEGRFDFPAYVGFTAATGGRTDEHRIRALTVDRHLCGADGTTREE